MCFGAVDGRLLQEIDSFAQGELWQRRERWSNEFLRNRSPNNYYIKLEINSPIHFAAVALGIKTEVFVGGTVGAHLFDVDTFKFIIAILTFNYKHKNNQ